MAERGVEARRAPGTAKLTNAARNRPSMCDIRHWSAGTRHLIPHEKRTRSQQTVVHRPEQVPAYPKEILHEAVHG